MKDVVVAAEVYQPGTGFTRLTREELALAYRSSVLQRTDGILLEALLRLTPGEEEVIRAKDERVERPAEGETTFRVSQRRQCF